MTRLRSMFVVALGCAAGIAAAQVPGLRFEPTSTGYARMWVIRSNALSHDVLPIVNPGSGQFDSGDDTEVLTYDWPSGFLVTGTPGSVVCGRVGISAVVNAGDILPDWTDADYVAGNACLPMQVTYEGYVPPAGTAMPDRISVVVTWKRAVSRAATENPAGYELLVLSTSSWTHAHAWYGHWSNKYASAYWPNPHNYNANRKWIGCSGRDGNAAAYGTDQQVDFTTPLVLERVPGTSNYRRTGVSLPIGSQGVYVRAGVNMIDHIGQARVGQAISISSAGSAIANPRTISGSIALEGTLDVHQEQEYTFRLVKTSGPDAGTTVTLDHCVTDYYSPASATSTGTGRQFEIPYSFADGNFDLYIYTLGYLAKKVSLVSAAGAIAGVNVTLKAGDVNRDNKVDSKDQDVYGLGSGLRIVDWNWIASPYSVNPIPENNGTAYSYADINKDGVVSSADKALIDANVGLVGD